MPATRRGGDVNVEALEFAVTVTAALIVLGVIIEAFRLLENRRLHRAEQHRLDCWRHRHPGHDDDDQGTYEGGWP